MLKIYLDWNCITHSKDRFPYILEIAEECASRFIFPYSNAHIRDLLVSRSSNNEYYQQDLDLLTRICGKHFLHFDGKVMQPMFGLPQDFIDECGDLLEIIQKTEFINPTLYQQIKEHTRSYIPKDLYKRIQGAEPKDAIKLINHYIQTIQPDKNLHSIMEESNPFKQLSTIESQFKSVCLGLDVFGFHPEKKNKQITNIDADANHIFYAAHCDYLVSDDKGMIAKAKATENDLEGLASMPRQVEGVWVGATMREVEDGAFKVSIRTGPSVDACAIAKQLGGGGQGAAAGCTIDGPLDAAMANILEAIRTAIPEIEKFFTFK